MEEREEGKKGRVEIVVSSLFLSHDLSFLSLTHTISLMPRVSVKFEGGRFLHQVYIRWFVLSRAYTLAAPTISLFTLLSSIYSCFRRLDSKTYLPEQRFSLSVFLCPCVHTYEQNPNAPSPLGQMAPNDGIPGGPMGPGFFPVSLQTSSIRTS